MHHHASTVCEFSDLILQQQRPIADEASTWHDQPPTTTTGQEEDHQEGDTKEQDKPANDTQQDEEDVTTSFMETTIMLEDELSEWEKHTQSIKSRAKLMSQQHEQQSHQMNEQFASLADRFGHIMQDQAQHSHDTQRQLRLLLHSLYGNKSALFSTPQHHRLEGLQEENARKNWTRLLVKYHLGRKLERVEIESALQDGEISSDIQAPEVLDMIDYVLAFIFEADAK